MYIKINKLRKLNALRYSQLKRQCDFLVSNPQISRYIGLYGIGDNKGTNSKV